jgi:curved DNA-binding protein CbpA
VEAESFVDYYEAMGLIPSASQEAIALRFRSLARRFHPDNAITGNRAKFETILQANFILRDRNRRSQYHKENSHRLPPLPAEDEHVAEGLRDALHDDADAEFVDGLGIDKDTVIQNNLLTMLYLQRRRNIKEPGIGNAELERLSGCSHEHLEFHIWYLREKGWIARGEDGLLAITVDGVDRAAHIYQTEQRLITDQS